MIASMTPVTHCVCGHEYEGFEFATDFSSVRCAECNRAVSGMNIWTDNPMKESDEQIAKHVKESHMNRSNGGRN